MSSVSPVSDLPETQTRPLMSALVRMGLAGEGEAVRITPLTGGVSSLIVRVDAGGQTFCVKQALPELKVALHWSAPLSRSHAELAWIREAGRIAPGSVPAILGEDRASFCFAMSWLAPAQHPVWKLQLRDGHAEAAFAAAVGSTLAQIHAATAHRAELAETFAFDEHFFELRLDPYFGQAARVHADCAPILQQLIADTAARKIALVHGDVSPKNLLAGPAGPVFLDAECAWYGDPAFDAAFCLCHLLAKCLWRPASAPAFLACFDAFATTYLQGATWEATPALEARIARLLAAILLARVDGKSPLEYLTEPDRAKQRAFALRWVRDPASQLSTLRKAWANDVLTEALS